ncbi:putative NAD(P)H nitroreductase YodC [compost metagenome]
MNVRMDNSSDFLTLLNERHAVKVFDDNYRMNEDIIRSLLQSASKAPSAWNLQHWKFIVVTEQTHKEILYKSAYGQRQIVEASVVVVILGDLQANRNAEKVMEPDLKAGQMSPEIKRNLISQIEQAYTHPVWARDQAICNASLAAMQLMLAAKAMGLDTCPMGGFDSNKLVEDFAIPNRYVPIMLVAVGKAAKPARPSLRLPIEEMIVWNRFE